MADASPASTMRLWRARLLLALARRAQAGVHVIDPRSANRLFWHEGEASDWVDTRDYAAALDRAVHDCGDAGGIIAAVLQPFQAVDQPGNDRTIAGDADDAAHERRLREVRKRGAALHWRRSGAKPHIKPHRPSMQS